MMPPAGSIRGLTRRRQGRYGERLTGLLGYLLRLLSLKLPL
jgi:hypothetical protein